MPLVVRRQSAILDIIRIADYLAEHVSLSTADRFAAAVDKTTRRLARMRRLGRHWDSNKSRLAEIRFFPVEKFRKHIIFYRPIEDGIEVLRVPHGATNLEQTLDEPEEGNI
jgi:toxin ParE1/3/4